MKLYCLIGWLAFLLASSVSYAQSLDNIGQQKPFTLHGGISLRTMFYQADGIPNRRQPFTYLLSGSPTVSIYGFSIPVSFIYSEQERSFRQPFNQFGLSPSYKWITLHGGYRNVSFSPFTLDGYTMLGAGFELRPGKWHLGFMYGRLNRAVVANQNLGDLQPISFSRKGMAGKIGYGTDTTNISFTFLKAKDDPGSVDYKQVGQDTLGIPSVTPAENLALSIGGRLGFLKHFFVEGDVALSLYTNNVDATLRIDTSVASVPDWLGSVVTVNASSEISKAIQAGVGYRSKTFGLSFRYRRIDPNYQSMGAYFFQNDLENFTLNPVLLLWKGKLRFNGSLGIQHDNLSGRKQATAERIIGSAALSAAFTDRLGVDFSYSNFATSQTPVAVKFNDSLRVAQTTQNFSLTPHYFVISPTHNHVFTLSLNWMQLNDFSVFSQSRNIRSANAFFNYQIIFNTSGMSLFTGVNYTQLRTEPINSGNQGVSIGGGKSFLKNALTIRLTNSFLQNRQGTTTTMLYTHGLSGSYRLAKKHNFNCNLTYLNNQGSVETQALGGYPKFTELRGDLGYTFTF
jgi:hypothetical protein